MAALEFDRSDEDAYTEEMMEVDQPKMYA